MHYKADVNAPDNDGNTPLHLCTANGHDQVNEQFCMLYIVVDLVQKRLAAK